MGNTELRFVETKVFYLDPEMVELIGSNHIDGEAVPFCFDMDDIIGGSMIDDDDDMQIKGKTRIHFLGGDVIAIDMYYPRFVKMFKEYRTSSE